MGIESSGIAEVHSTVTVHVDPGKLLVSLDVASYVLRACSSRMWNFRNYQSAIAARSTAETLEQLRRDCAGLSSNES